MGGKRGLHALLAAQSFWVTIVPVVICGVMSYREPASFGHDGDNFFNHLRATSPHRRHGARHDPVINHGGIDLSVRLGDGSRRHRLRSRAPEAADPVHARLVERVDVDA